MLTCSIEPKRHGTSVAVVIFRRVLAHFLDARRCSQASAKVERNNSEVVLSLINRALPKGGLQDETRQGDYDRNARRCHGRYSCGCSACTCPPQGSDERCKRWRQRVFSSPSTIVPCDTVIGGMASVTATADGALAIALALSFRSTLARDFDAIIVIGTVIIVAAGDNIATDAVGSAKQAPGSDCTPLGSLRASHAESCESV